MGHGDFAAVVGIMVIFGMPVAFAISSRWMAHQERMAMIQRGMAPPPVYGRGFRRDAQSGATPPMGTVPVHEIDYSEWQANRMLHKGIVVAMIGLALLIGLSFIDGIVGFHGPWLLGGLIPLFIGIAQIIIAVLSGARLGGFRGVMPPPLSGTSAQPGAPPFTAPPPRDVTPGPYAWRPGPTTELEKPPGPPDHR